MIYGGKWIKGGSMAMISFATESYRRDKDGWYNENKIAWLKSDKYQWLRMKDIKSTDRKIFNWTRCMANKGIK